MTAKWMLTIVLHRFLAPILLALYVRIPDWGPYADSWADFGPDAAE